MLNSTINEKSLLLRHAVYCYCRIYRQILHSVKSWINRNLNMSEQKSNSIYDSDSLPDILPFYYKRLFPFGLYCQWLRYGNRK